MNEKRATLKDISNNLSVSVTTIANALKGNPNVSDALRQRIIEEADRLGYKPNYNARALVKNGITIGYLSAEEPHEYLQSFLKGINDEIKRLADYKVQLKLFTFRDNSSNVEARDCALRMTKEPLDGLILSTSFDSSGYIDIVIDYIKANQVPTVYNDVYDDVPHIGSIAVDSVIVGKLVAQLVSIFCGRKAKIGVISTSPNYITHAKIVETLKDNCKNYDIEVKEVLYNYDSQSATYGCADHLVTTYPDLDLIYVTSFNTIPVCKCLQNKGLSERIKVIGHDAYKELVPYFESGQQVASIYQNPQFVGSQCVKMLVQAVIGEMPKIKEIKIRPEVILNSNIESYIE